MRSLARHKSRAPSLAGVDYLLVSTLAATTAGRIRASLESAGIDSADSELGLEVYCGGLPWAAVLERVAASLTPAEQRETRVAMIAPGDDPAALHRAIFRAQGLDSLLSQTHQEWFNSILQADGIAIHFQPLMQYPPGRVHGYECLMRGVDRGGNLIPPSRMFETARQLDRVRQLDEQCRKAALNAAAEAATGDASFFINFSPSAIAEPRKFIVETMRQLENSRLRPDQIVYEVVETDKIDDRRRLLDMLRCFRKAGFKVALDDVGAGYSSLLNLSYLRPDYIKLDGELVRRGASRTLEAKMVADLAETARQNGIITVAEGVETAQELQLVLASGIHIIQGYYLARPAPQLLTDVQVRNIAATMNSAAPRNRPARNCA